MNPRPRIGLVAHEYPPLVGGMATYARALVRYLSQRGYEVHVFTHAGAGREARVHPILTTDLARDLPRLAGFRMDLWHAVNFGYAPLACVQRPFVLTVHGTDFLRPWVGWKLERVPFLWRAAALLGSPRVQRPLCGPPLRCVDRVLTCSRFSAERFRREYPSAPRPRVVPNGVDEAFLDAGDAPRPGARHPRRLLTVCNLDCHNRRKNVDGVLRALALVGGRLDLEYWIVGDGVERGPLQSLARDLGIADRVRFCGRLNRAELIAAYASSSLFVLVPRAEPRDVEGFGIVYLEAAALGTPSLAGRHGGAEDAVADGISGFFTTAAGPSAIADGLCRFFGGQVTFEPRRVREHARQYSWDKVLKKVENVYRELLGRGKGRSNMRSDIPQEPGAAPVEPHISTLRPHARNPAPHPPRRRVLIISYPFPPVGGSGVQRPAKLARYLPDCGWDVDVLTVDHERFPWRDETLLDDLPDRVRVHRLSGYEPACVARRAVSCLRFHSPAARRWAEDRLYWRLARWAGGSPRAAGLGGAHGESGWVRPAIAAAHALHRRHPCSAVISTGPPHFVHAVALAFSRAAGIPWLADLRDPLISDFDRTPATAAQRQTQRRFERLLMRRADAVVTTCEAFADDLRLRYPARSASIRCIFNGFDPRDLTAPHGHAADPRGAGRCTLLAAGSFYGRRELRRLLWPLAAVLARRPEWAGRVGLRLVGTVDAQQRRELDRARPPWLTIEGYVPHQEAIARAFQADCSIVLVPDCAHGRMSIPAKTFELLAIPRHILGLVPPGSETARILASAGACTLAALEDERAVEAALERVIAGHFAGTLADQRDWDALGRYDRRHIAGQFAAALDDLAGPRRPPVIETDAADPGAKLVLDRRSGSPAKAARSSAKAAGSPAGHRPSALTREPAGRRVRRGLMAPSIRRLLFVTDAPGFGGAERYLLDMAGAARRRGIEPHILWLRLPESDPRTFAGAGDGDVPLTVVTPDRTRSWRGLAGAVREVLVRWNPDALIVNACGRLRFWSLTWMARRHGIPALWVQHMVEGRDPRQLRPGRLGGRMEGLALWRIPQALRHRLAAAAATSVIVSSQRDRESIVRWHRVPPAKVCVIAPGVDVNRFRFDAAAGQRLRVEWGRARRRNLEGPGEPFLVGTAARLVAGKGAERLIAAVAQLHRRKRNVLAVIAGGGPQRDALAGLAQARGVADHVLVVDFVADMPAFYSALDMFALCSDTESFGLTLAEAMACERPVVATPTAGARLQIVHRVTGHQLEGFSAGELADALDRLAHAPGLREHMGRQGRQRVIDCFCIERTLDRTLAALRHHRAMTCRPVGEAAVIGPAGRPIASLAPFSGR